MNKKYLYLLFIETFLLVATSCQILPPTTDNEVYTLDIPPPKEQKKERQKIEEVILSEDDISKFQQSLRMFSGALYFKIMRQTNETNNIFFSPASISHALAMVNSGSENETRKQIQRALRLGESRPSELNALFRNVTSNKFKAKKNDEVVALMASRSFFKPTYEVYKNYTDILRKSYYSGMDYVDFSDNVKAAKKINKWVENKTNGLIKDLISPDLFTPLTRFVLANALYFKAPWLKTFTRLTMQKDFQTPSGNVSATFLKSYRGEFKFNESKDLIEVAVPYKDQKTLFVIIMPKSDKAMEEFTSQRNLEIYFRILKKRVRQLKMQKINLYMPEFTVEKSLDVKKILKTMGVRDLFSSANANLSGISEEFVYVSDFVHKARITVDKNGTEAAAATAVISSARSLYGAQSVIINRPFIYAIYEEGNILFMGRMTNPSEK